MKSLNIKGINCKISNGLNIDDITVNNSNVHSVDISSNKAIIEFACDVDPRLIRKTMSKIYNLGSDENFKHRGNIRYASSCNIFKITIPDIYYSDSSFIHIASMMDKPFISNVIGPVILPDGSRCVYVHIDDVTKVKEFIYDEFWTRQNNKFKPSLVFISNN